MNTKENYISPVIEIVELEIEGVIASSDPMNGENDGPSNSKRRRFWNEE